MRVLTFLFFSVFLSSFSIFSMEKENTSNDGAQNNSEGRQKAKYVGLENVAIHWMHVVESPIQGEQYKTVLYIAGFPHYLFYRGSLQRFRSPGIKVSIIFEIVRLHNSEQRWIHLIDREICSLSWIDGCKVKVVVNLSRSFKI